MKRDYEITVVVRLDTDEATVNSTIEQVKTWIETEHQGQITKTDRWGRKKLSYEIDRQREGYYVFYECNMESRGLGEFERNLNLNPNLLRYLVVRKDD